MFEYVDFKGVSVVNFGEADVVEFDVEFKVMSVVRFVVFGSCAVEFKGIFVIEVFSWFGVSVTVTVGIVVKFKLSDV